MIQNATITLDENGLNLFMAARKMVESSEVVAMYASQVYKRPGLYLLNETEAITELKEQINALELKNMELKDKLKNSLNEAGSLKYFVEEKQRLIDAYERLIPDIKERKEKEDKKWYSR